MILASTFHRSRSRSRVLQSTLAAPGSAKKPGFFGKSGFLAPRKTKSGAKDLLSADAVEIPLLTPAALVDYEMIYSNCKRAGKGD